MLNTAEKSTILLLCLGLDTDKSEVKKIGIAELKEIFAVYGHLKKVIIFTRKVLLKAFLEYDDFETAETAKNSIHEKFVKNYGKARLYFSPMQDLKYSNKYLEYWEESSQEIPLFVEDDISTKLSAKQSVSENSNVISFRKDSFQSCIQNPGMPRGQYTLFSNSSELSESSLNRDSFLSNINLIFNSQQCVFNTGVSSSNYTRFSQLELCEEQSTIEPENVDVLSLSKVILISNLSHVFKNTEELFNLFSAFGNIAKILFMKNLQKALVEYVEAKYASEAVTHLNNTVLGDTILRISYSRYRTIDLGKNNKNENSMQYNEVLIVPSMRNRYKSNSQFKINAPSSTLLITTPKIGGIQYEDIYHAIERFRKPLKTKIVKNKSMFGSSEIINLLFSFENVETAIYVMCKCHNNIVKGALLDIFFI